MRICCVDEEASVQAKMPTSRPALGNHGPRGSKTGNSVDSTRFADTDTKALWSSSNR